MAKNNLLLVFDALKLTSKAGVYVLGVNRADKQPVFESSVNPEGSDDLAGLA
jgi:hypothetical protein